MRVDANRGRAPVRSALADALGAACEGSGGLILLLGDAGIGKTTTARELATSARRRGVTVRWSACWSGGGTVAHAPWLTLLSGLGAPGRSAMDRLLGSDLDDAAAVAPARTSAYAAVVEALESATTEQAALLVIDDLHWADEGTLELLDVVAAHLPGLAVLVVGTY
ncbi:MAG TPA: ATP-binding protein, partial [Acidimicrobiales bacterium]